MCCYWSKETREKAIDRCALEKKRRLSLQEKGALWPGTNMKFSSSVCLYIRDAAAMHGDMRGREWDWGWRGRQWWRTSGNVREWGIRRGEQAGGYLWCGHLLGVASSSLATSAADDTSRCRLLSPSVKLWGYYFSHKIYVSRGGTGWRRGNTVNTELKPLKLLAGLC